MDIKNNSIVILGSSKNSQEISQYISDCADITKWLVQNNFNIITGCGTKGIMGQAYKTAAEYSVKTNDKPVQNQAIIREPLWGDEDLKNCVVIDKANTESERLHKFLDVSDVFIIFPGGITSVQEAATLIQENRHRGYDKKVILYGEIFWSGLISQYLNIFRQNIIKENPVGKEFFIANTKDDIIKLLDISIR